MPSSTIMTTAEKATYDANVLQLAGIAAGSGAVQAAINAAQYGISSKAAVLVATSNLTRSGEQTIDSVLTSATRVLLTGQTALAENGLYVTAAGAWARTTDMATGADASGAMVVIERGTLRAGTAWICTGAAGADVVGTNSLPFTEFDIGALTVARVIALLAGAASDIAINTHKITGLSNGGAASDAAAFGQIPVVATAAPLDVTYPAAVGASAKWAAEDHAHQRARSAANMNFRCDFGAPATANHVAATYYTGALADPGFVITNANSAAGATLDTSNTASAIGVLYISTGTTTNGSSCAQTGSTLAGCMITPASANPFWFEAKIECADAVSDGTNTYKIIAGLSDTVNGAPANGVWFEADANSDTHILVKTCAGGAGNVVTAVTSTIVMGTATFHIVRITKPAGTLTANVYIDNMVTPVGTCTIPTAVMCPTLQITKSAGALARRLGCDWFDMDQTWATPRT